MSVFSRSSFRTARRTGKAGKGKTGHGEVVWDKMYDIEVRETEREGCDGKCVDLSVICGDKKMEIRKF